ncbi:hypothetical protein GJ496_005691 [Pomphorhynchus laevis]|nr:hypothetical protein GJ496_005691 [Pomphorhynchus laevis]
MKLVRFIRNYNPQRQGGNYRIIRNINFRSSCSPESDVYNEVGIQMLQENIRHKLFPNCKSKSNQSYSEEEKSKLKDIYNHLSKFNINPVNSDSLTNGSREQIYNINKLSIPNLLGADLAEHFWKIALDQIHPYLRHLHALLSDFDEISLPANWPTLNAGGWFRTLKLNKESSSTLSATKWTSIEFPSDDALVFDVETLSAYNLPCLAVALSTNYWYIWISPNLINPDFSRFNLTGIELSSDDLISIESSCNKERKKARVILGHNVSFDRSFLSNQYDWTNELSGLRFIDTFSWHVACSGLGSNQRQSFQFLNQQHQKNYVQHHDDNHDMENPAQIWANSFASSRNLNAPNLNWMNESSPNNLADVLSLYCPDEPALSKETRSIFTRYSCADPINNVIETLQSKFDELCTYCANDVIATLKVARSLYPLFLDRFPHPVTMSGMLEMSTMILPVKKTSWTQYIYRSKQIYKDTALDLNKILGRYADEACSYIANNAYLFDNWLHSLDWSVQSIKLKRIPPKTGKSKNLKLNDDGNKKRFEEFVDDIKVGHYDEFPDALSKMSESVIHALSTYIMLPKRVSFRSGYPKWYRDLCLKTTEFCSPVSNSSVPQPSVTEYFENDVTSPYHGAKLLTIRNQITPYILKLLWTEYPLHHDRKLGWGFLHVKTTSLQDNDQCSDLPTSPDSLQLANNVQKFDREDLGKHTVIFDDIKVSNRNNFLACTKTDKDYIPPHSEGPFNCNTIHPFYKITHPTGKLNANVGNPLAKSFHVHVLSGLLRTYYTSLDIFNLIAYAQMISYWENSVARISSQLLISYPDKKSDWAAIIPRTIVCGTVTRRAVERTWLTASNPTLDRIGSELKCMIQTPESHCFVGADVDSQEMWIAGLLGDRKYGVHGSTACSWMLLKGDKSNGTDLHSHIASTIDISRDHAKVLNYARIYGAGANYATRLLCAFNPKLKWEDAKKKVTLMYKRTKGIRQSNSTITDVNNSSIQSSDLNNSSEVKPWFGGSESEIFNALESIALNEKPCTPVLGARMTRALEPRNVGNDFMTSRINWVVQSSAVDYLHLILTCMRWLSSNQSQKYIKDSKTNAVAAKDKTETCCFSRLSLSIHDEIRYISLRKDSYTTALNLQISNLFTRAAFAYQIMKSVDKNGDLIIPKHIAPPSSVCFFSSVEIDKCLRKNVNSQCMTPSNPLGLMVGYSIPKGEDINIHRLLDISSKDIDL